MRSIDLAEIRAMGQSLRQNPHQAAVLAELLSLINDHEPKRARYAVLALGGAEGDVNVEKRLHELWHQAKVLPEMRRALVKTLGVVGGASTLELLSNYNDDAAHQDRELQRLLARSLLILKRRQNRQELNSPNGGAILAEQPMSGLKLRFTCRNGLEKFLVRELPGSRSMGVGRVGVTLTGPLSSVWQARTFESFVLPLTPVDIVDGDIKSAAVASLTGRTARHLLSKLTKGPIRIRLAWHGDGRQKQLIWQIAESLHKQWPELINDPSASLWQAELFPRGQKLYIDLLPKGLIDPRFSYRHSDIPAASHPPLAAALVKLAGSFADDIVWDPFVGSGTELIERALLGPAREIFGSDRCPEALNAAKTNIQAAGLEKIIKLNLADALEPLGKKVNLIITNPPLGRRVAHNEVGELLSDFLQKAAETLVVGGRLVWVSPDSSRHRAIAARFGLQQTFAQVVDMGGFPATLQRFVKLDQPLG